MIIDEIRKTNTPYPKWVLKDSNSACMFFCAAFMGQNDVIHFERMGNVTLVDQHILNLHKMKSIYPKMWTYIDGDCFEEATKMRKIGKSFDVVNCDPWVSGAIEIVNTKFNLFFDIANRYFVFLVPNNEFLLKYKIDTKEKMSEHLSFVHRRDVHIVDIIMRTDQGICWAVASK